VEYVFSANDGLVRWSDTRVSMSPNDVWFADDPFVVARPDLFSTTPLVVHSTQGRQAPPAAPLAAAAAKGRSRRV